jgi:hypothetical protein
VGVAPKILSHINLAAELCEIVSSRELCIGEKITTEKRLQKACKLILKEGLPWQTVQAALTGSSEDENVKSCLTRQLARAGRTGVCEKVF